MNFLDKNSHKLSNKIAELDWIPRRHALKRFRLDTKFKIVLVRLEVLTTPRQDLNKREGRIEAYLDTFCIWQQKLNPGANQIFPDRQNPDHWDHGLMLTGK